MIMIRMDQSAYNSFTITKCYGPGNDTKGNKQHTNKCKCKCAPARVVLYYITLKGGSGNRVEKFAKM